LTTRMTSCHISERRRVRSLAEIVHLLVAVQVGVLALHRSVHLRAAQIPSSLFHYPLDLYKAFILAFSNTSKHCRPPSTFKGSTSLRCPRRGQRSLPALISVMKTPPMIPSTTARTTTRRHRHGHRAPYHPTTPSIQDHSICHLRILVLTRTTGRSTTATLVRFRR
jgi:hypothetical protein